MALSATNTSICNKLLSDYNSIAAPIYAAKAMVRSKMAEVETLLRDMAFSFQQDVLDKLLVFQNDIAAALPKADMAAMNELKQFMDQCVYLNDVSPMSIIMGTAAGVNDQINNLVNTAGYDEFIASGMFSDINDSFSAGGVTNSFIKVNELMNCLNSLSLCGTEQKYLDAAQGIQSDLTILYGSLNVIDSGPNYGKFDTEVVYNNAGLEPTQQDTINQVTSGIDGAKSDGASAIAASASKVQELTKAGDFF